MDPDALLSELRQTCLKLRDQELDPEANELTEAEWRLMVQFDALDDWLSHTGFLPMVWGKRR